MSFKFKNCISDIPFLSRFFKIRACDQKFPLCPLPRFKDIIRRRQLHKYNTGESGSALSEFVIIIPFFIIMIGAVVGLGQILMESSMAYQNVYEVARRAATSPTSTSEADLLIFARNLSIHWGKFAEVGLEDQLDFNFVDSSDQRAARVNVEYASPLKRIMSGGYIDILGSTRSRMSAPYIFSSPVLDNSLQLPLNPVVLIPCANNGIIYGDLC